MDRRRIGLALVLAFAGGILLLKQGGRSAAPVNDATEQGAPQVLILVDPREAEGEDGCARIIEAVRDVEKRHVRVVRFEPGDTSGLIARYRVLVSPTVLIMAPDGTVSARFEGESPAVVAAVEAGLAQIRPNT